MRRSLLAMQLASAIAKVGEHPAEVIVETKVRREHGNGAWSARARYKDRSDYVLDGGGRAPLQAGGPTAHASVAALEGRLPQGLRVHKRVKYDTNCQRWEEL